MLAWIRQELRAQGWEVVDDSFTAQTPAGPIAMQNLIARRSGFDRPRRRRQRPHRYQALSVPLRRRERRGLFHRRIARTCPRLEDVPLRNDVWLIFFDGEEALGDWSDTDSVYGSRHLAAKWAADGTLKHLDALINVEMIGDRDLHIVDEYGSTPALRRLLRAAAARTNHAGAILRDPSSIEDDHVPFLRQGVAAIDLIDFDYGPNNSWWHTAKDTVDKLSPASLKTTGAIVMEMLRILEPGAGAR